MGAQFSLLPLHPKKVPKWSKKNTTNSSKNNQNLHRNINGNEQRLQRGFIVWINIYKNRNKAFWEKKMKKTHIISTKAKNIYKQNEKTKTIQEKDLNFKTIKKIKPKDTIEIYDITYSPEHKNKEVFNVKDHINKTGTNPLRGKQNKTQQDFTDLSNVYNQKQGVITNSLGSKYEEKKNTHNFPSTTLSNISIFLKGCGHNNILGKLINKIK